MVTVPTYEIFLFRRGLWSRLGCWRWGEQCHRQSSEGSLTSPEFLGWHPGIQTAYRIRDATSNHQKQTRQKPTCQKQTRQIWQTVNWSKVNSSKNQLVKQNNLTGQNTFSMHRKQSSCSHCYILVFGPYWMHLFGLQMQTQRWMKALIRGEL